MVRLPVIVGFGGVNAAGRSSFHHGYCRMVADALPASALEHPYRSLQQLMQLDPAGKSAPELRQQIDAGTLVRRLESRYFDPDQLHWHRHFPLEGEQPISFTCRSTQLPKRLPPEWQITPLAGDQVQVTAHAPQALYLPAPYESQVKVAGQLPSGFDPGRGYASHHQPRGLQMTVFGASDALQTVGIDWEEIRQRVNPVEIGVYAGSAMGQLDEAGNGGLLSARSRGRQPTSKQCALGFAQMPADFINAYLLGSVGYTSSNMGACASFLYNLNQAVRDIQAGRIRVAVVGNSEAPITQEIVEGYAAMSALATDAELLALDGADTPDYRRASRPFGRNCGFVLAESAQFLVLFDDALALELGATIYGGINEVFIHADGYKRSISAPGVGNYITLARAVAAARDLLGETAIRHRSYVQAHGSSTPQNRVTESHILDNTARAFGIERWPVAAVKCYLGHSLGAAAGDQLAASLGVWAHGYLPGITTLDQVAEDVHAERLLLSRHHQEVGREGIDVTFLNAKGFGGNNASACLLAPHVVKRLLAKRHGAEAMGQYAARNAVVQQAAEAYQAAILRGEDRPIYRFGQGILGAEDVQLDGEQLTLNGHHAAIRFESSPLYPDLREP